MVPVLLLEGVGSMTRFGAKNNSPNGFKLSQEAVWTKGKT